MKYLKTFESKSLDDVLDKVAKTGMKSLTPSEDRLLKNYYKGDVEKLELDLRDKKERIKGQKEFNPKEDSMYFLKKPDKSYVPFEYTDDMFEMDKYGMIWDEIDNEDLDHFIEYHDIKDGKKEIGKEIIHRPWDELSDETQLKFKEYIDEMY